LRLELRFAVRDRARFLSHLECVDVLLAAFRRAGYDVELSRGMRPKPVISLALARAVGVESEDELASVRLVGEHSPADVAAALAAALPRGIEIRSAREANGPVRVVQSRFRVELDAGAATVAAAAVAYAELAEAPVERRSPKRAKIVDVKSFAPFVEPVDGGFEVEVAVRDEGSARPEELVRALEACASAQLPIRRVTRIELRVESAVPAAVALGERE
jgi:radical SAM-linked protein